jgi:hypothetical protein
MSTGLALLNGATLGDALKEGGKGAAMGFGTGVVTGVATGVRAAHKANKNPWTGKDIYPANDGFAGEINSLTLKSGDVVDRYGGTTDRSRFLSPQGTPIEARSLPSDTNLNLYDKFQVVRSFPVQSGTVAPWFGQPGGGIQYNTQIPINVLVNRGYLIKY